jgi:acetyl-CoA/propionyl-CoA carboxylase carboxyl transferase subunit
MGGPEAVERQHARGRLSPRERVDLLLDPGSFHEVGELVVGVVVVPGRPDREAPGDGVVVGWGLVDGRRVFVISDDGTIAAGSRGHAANRKADLVVSLARNHALPLVWFAEASVNRMQHVMGSQFAGELERDLGVSFPSRRAAKAPAVVAISGQSVGRASFSAMHSEFTTLARGSSSMALAGPAIVRAAIGDDISSEDLGGVAMHARGTGEIDYVGASEAGAIDGIKRFLGYLPDNADQAPPRVATDDPPDRGCPELYDIVPLAYRRAYDMRKVVQAIVDDGSFLEVKGLFARNIICAYARIDGWSVGIVANNPLYQAGVLDPDALKKLFAFVAVCNLYNVPLVFLQDQPGVMPGPQAERQGVIRQVTRAMNAMRSITVPVLTVLVRKCYGFSYMLLGSRAFGGDVVVAWPSAAVSLAGPEAGVSTVLAAEERAGTLTEERRTEVIHDYIEDARARWAASAGRIDDIIEPERTRVFLAGQLGFFASRGPSSRTGEKAAVGL